MAIEFFGDTPLPAALTALNDEQDRLEAEITAFEEFSDRVANVQPEVPQTAGTPTTISAADQKQSESQSPYEAICRAYQETVLTVDHWRECYEETTVAESFAEEFSPTLADCLVSRLPPPFSATIQTQLEAAITDSIQSRSQTYEYLTREEDRLCQLQTQLDALLDQVAPVECSDEPFEKQDQRLSTAFDSLEELTQTHQEYIHARDAHGDKVLSELIYADMNTTYPGLATLALVRLVLNRLELRLWAGLLDQ